MYKILEFSYNIYPFIKKDTFQVAIRVRWCAKRREVSFITGMYAEPDKWDGDCHKAKKGTTHKFGNRQYLASEINAIISEYKQEIDAFFKQCALLSHIPTTDELKQHVNDQLRPKEQPIEKPITKPTDMKELFRQFLSVNTKEKNWSERVREKYTQTFNHILTAMPKLKVTDIDKQMMLNLRDWYVKQDFMHSTINHRMTIALSIFKWINNNTPYNIPEEVFTFRTNLKEAPHTITFLNYDELQAFYHYQFTNERLSRARDQFCFMAFTSLRISDFKRLMVANIIDQHIEIVAKKTDEHMTIPLVANALEIIEKYKDERPEDGRLFNVISDQKLNTYIKEAAKEAGLNRKVVFTYYKGGTRIEEQKEFWEIISCHDARRTFVSCSLAMGIPENYIRKCSGHKNLRTMAPYMGVGLEAQTTEMAKWNKEPSHTQSNILQAVAGLNEDQLNKVMQLIEMFKAIS